MNPAIARPLRSRLPEVGTSIFSRMTQLANQHGAINLAQGFPDFAADPSLIEAVAEAMREGHNQYAPAVGVPALREAVARQQHTQHGVTYDADAEVTITTGGTAALYAALAALTQPGDEVLVLDPAYDSYAPVIRLGSAVPVHVPLRFPSFRIDWQALEQAASPRTRAIVVNTPHNPSGALLSAEDRERLAAFAERHDLWVIADEVYEYLVFDGLTHHSIAQHPQLRERAVVIGSFGKSLHVTGWKVGYALAPAALTAELRKVHQFMTFTVHTPTQVGIARYLEARPDYAATLGALYQQKRDLFSELMQETAFAPLPTHGSYFQLYSYANLFDGAGAMSELAMAEWLTEHAGVASIPVSAFYADGAEHGVLRFCFAKKEVTLRAAVERLKQIPNPLPSRL
jgi:methionine transaminase